MRTEEILERIKNLATGKKTEERVFSLSAGNVPPVPEQELPDWSEPPEPVITARVHIPDSGVISNMSGSSGILYIPRTPDPEFEVDDWTKEHYPADYGIVGDMGDVEFGEVEYPSILGTDYVQKAFEFGEDREMVEHPDHYNRGGIEAIDVIEAWELNFSRGCIVKGVCRAGYKTKSAEGQIEDMGKIIFYAKREIERLRSDEND